MIPGRKDRETEMDQRQESILVELRRCLAAAAANELCRLILFGSRARDDASGDSDLDVAAIVKERTPDLERRLDDAVYDLMWEHDFQPIISLKVFSEAQFDGALEKGVPFYRNVAREGIPL